MIDEIIDYLELFIEEHEREALRKLAEKLEKTHRGNTIPIIRSWDDELNKMKATITKREKK
jgi:hypothetical protein